jgi:hypothetical protein
MGHKIVAYEHQYQHQKNVISAAGIHSQGNKAKKQSKPVLMVLNFMPQMIFAESVFSRKPIKN